MAEIEPNDVNVMLHSPRERDFARVLPSLVQSNPQAFLTFQSSHSKNAERALKKGRTYLASFIRLGDGRLVFSGLFQNYGWKDRKMGDIWLDPDIRFLHETYGLDYGQSLDIAEEIFAWFDLRQTSLLQDLIGRLLVDVRLTQNYVRLCENLDAPIAAILESPVFENAPPEWQDLTATAAFVRAIPPGWAARLREWRGVYLIVDESDGARYVGSAYGEENILGRWRAHVSGDFGVTKELSRRNPLNFRFSILQLLAPSAEAKEVIGIEHNWMNRLHTREFGLNT